MNLFYTFEPSLLKKIIYVTHKAKGRSFQAKWHTHNQTAHEMIYVDYGKIKLDMDDGGMKLNPGECVFVPGSTGHSFWGADGAPFDFLNIMFTGDLPPSIFGKKQLLPKRCLELLEHMKEESVNELAYRNELLYSNLMEFIVLFYRHLESPAHGVCLEPAYQRRYHSEIVDMALNVIKQEFTTQLTLDKVSRAVSISKPHLCHLLKKETGDNFSTLLCRRRVDAAKHLIRESAHSLEKISNLVGYQSLSFFFKVFKRYAGMTPKAYARSLGDPEHIQ